MPVKLSIATVDVVNLHTNIPQGFALEAVRYSLSEYKENIHLRFNIPFISESIALTLRNNICTFDNDYFSSSMVLL